MCSLYKSYQVFFVVDVVVVTNIAQAVALAFPVEVSSSKNRFLVEEIIQPSPDVVVEPPELDPVILLENKGRIPGIGFLKKLSLAGLHPVGKSIVDKKVDVFFL